MAPARDAAHTAHTTRVSMAITPALAIALALAVALAGAALGIAHALRPASVLGDSPLLEDAFYALAVARHAALGHGLTADGVLPCNGFQPLWVFLNVPLYALTRGDRVLTLRYTLALATTVWIAFGVCVARAAARRVQPPDAPLARALGPCVTLGSYAVFRAFHNGLETGVLLVLLALAVERLDDPARRATPGTALVLAALVYARLDAALFVLAATALSITRDDRSPSGLAPLAPLASCAFAALALVPWLARNVRLDGHPVPTSGRAEALHIDLGRNAVATLAAVGQWTLAPFVRLPLWAPAAQVAGATAGVIAGVLFVRSRPSLRAQPTGTAALWVHLAGLAGYYTLAFGAPHFQDRYLAPALLVTLAPLAAAAARSPRRAAALALAVALANLPFLTCSLAGAGTLGGTTYNRQTAWVLARVQPECTVGAGQSGALGYFRDRVVNLDGKVNARALAAIRAHALRAYLDSAGVDVVIDWPVYIRGILGEAPSGFVRWGSAGRFDVWVRTGREGCVRPG